MNAPIMVDDVARVGKREVLREQAESWLIGCLLIAPETIDEIGSIVNADDFVYVPYRKLYALLIGMREAGQSVTFGSVLATASRSGLIEELGGKAECARLAHELPNGSQYRVYAEEVSRLSACRKAESAALNFLERLARPDCVPRKAIDALVARVQDLGVTASSQNRHIAELILAVHAAGNLPAETFDQQRISTGYPRVDELIGGLYPQTLCLLGGYYGSGKSAFCADIGAKAASQGKAVQLFSVEMTGEEFTQRVLSIETSIPMTAWQRPRTEEEQAKIANMAEYARQWRWAIDDTARQTLASIRAIARLRKASDGLDLLIVDNLTLIQSREEKKVERYKVITEELKRLSRELQCCVLLLAQLNADAAGKEPTETSWADCKAIQGDADVAMMLHREGESDDYLLVISKNRSRGPRGKVPMRWDGAYQRFTDETASEWNPN